MMRALEFETRLTSNGTLPVPEDIAAQVPRGQPVRVLLLVDEPVEDQEWARMGAAEFLKGYAESDAIYDRAPEITVIEVEGLEEMAATPDEDGRIALPLLAV